MATDTLTPAQAQYLEWLVMADSARVRLGLPRTDVEYAEANGVSDKTLRNWKRRPAFATALEARTALLAGQQNQSGPTQPAGSPSTGPEAGPVMPASGPAASHMLPSGEPDVAGVVAATFQLLASRIAEGDLKAVDPFLRMPTVKGYMDAQTAQLTATFEGLSDAELTATLLADFSTEELRAEVARRDAEEAATYIDTDDLGAGQ